MIHAKSVPLTHVFLLYDQGCHHKNRTEVQSEYKTHNDLVPILAFWNAQIGTVDAAE
jgi:hypothetical protein